MPLQEVGLGYIKLGQTSSTLSGGENQRIKLAYYLSQEKAKPTMFIFDEPTNGLDIISAKAVTDFLIDLKNQGKTVILSTHIFSLVEKLCDRVGIIIDGKMMVDDKLSNLVGDSNLEDVFFRIYNEKVGEF